MFVTTCNCNMKHKYISLIKAIKGLKDVDLRKKKDVDLGNQTVDVMPQTFKILIVLVVVIK